ncbi:MAG: cobalamin-binding protein [Anaerolineales bacterium]|jgi:iron complex transport system substrate-binding protein
MFRKYLIVLLIVPLLAACSSAQASSATSVPTQPANTLPSATANPSITLSDGLNRTVTLTSPAQRVVSLAPANTEILFAIGAGAQVVGRDETSDYPAVALSLPTIGGYSGFNLEAIVALHPDLVLAGGINTPELVSSLEQLGLTVYFLPNPNTLEEMYTNLETVAKLTGHETETAALVDSLKSRVAAVDSKIKPLSNSPTVYYELDATDPTKPYTAGPGSFVDLLIDRAGGINIGADLFTKWAQISLEQLVVANPGIIILGDSAYGETPAKVAARPGWGTLTAVQTGQIYAFDDNLVSRPGPRLVDGLEALAKLLHPDLFK